VSEIEARLKSTVTIIVIGGLWVFFAVYIAHEWVVGNSFDKIATFLENALSLFIGWCLRGRRQIPEKPPQGRRRSSSDRRT
jgi:hypothetical protein